MRALYGGGAGHLFFFFLAKKRGTGGLVDFRSTALVHSCPPQGPLQSWEDVLVHCLHLTLGEIKAQGSETCPLARQLGEKRKLGEEGRGRAGPSGFLERPRGGGPSWEGRIPTLGGRAPALQARCASRIRPAGGSIAQRRIPTEPGGAPTGPGAGSPRAPAGGGSWLVRGVEGRLGGGGIGAGREPDAQTRRRRVGPVPELERWSPDLWEGDAGEMVGGVLLPAGGDRGGLPERLSNQLVRRLLPRLKSDFATEKDPQLSRDGPTSSSGCLFFFSHRFLLISVFVSGLCNLSLSLPIPPGPSSCLFSPSLCPRGSSPSACLLVFPSLL